jgi:hypothetical protein
VLEEARAGWFGATLIPAAGVGLLNVLGCVVESDNDVGIAQEAAQLTCDAIAFVVQTDLAAWEDDTSVFTREWSFEIPRDHV